jgi:hypothetical protein
VRLEEVLTVPCPAKRDAVSSPALRDETYGNGATKMIPALKGPEGGSLRHVGSTPLAVRFEGILATLSAG